MESWVAGKRELTEAGIECEMVAEATGIIVDSGGNGDAENWRRLRWKRTNWKRRRRKRKIILNARLPWEQLALKGRGRLRLMIDGDD